jgi:peptide chain release factor 1
MSDRLQEARDRWEELNLLLSDPAVISNQARYRKLMKEHADLTPMVERYGEYAKCEAGLEEARALERDADEKDFRDLLREEIRGLEERRAALESELRAMLAPRDPNDERSVIVEIRAGAGGEEAALFAAKLFRMYAMYCERKRWKAETLDSSPTELGGLKEIVFEVDAPGAFSRLKFESGVHRVQRIPETEAGGRIHTSTATVAVLPEAEEVEVRVDPGDLQVDTFRAGGAGGQHINKTDSAIRITHLPTGIVVTCQDERSQHKNRDKAMKVLAAKLLDLERSRQDSKIVEDRRRQVGTGDRSERIRTYNFPQNRVTDHRIGLSLYRIHDVMDGDLDEIIDALSVADLSGEGPEAAAEDD